MTKSELKSLKQLHLKKYRDEQKFFLVEGKRSVVEAIKEKCDIDLILICNELAEKEKELIRQIEKNMIRFEIIPYNEIQRISDVENSQGIIAKIKFLNYDESQIFNKKNEKKRIIFLENISDPGNMGTIIRTADWFNIDSVIICGDSVDIYNPKVVRSTMGSLFHVPIFVFDDVQKTIKKLKDSGYTIYASDLKGESYNKVSYSIKSVIVFGNEAHGISETIKKYADKLITIKGKGKAESLNVAVSVGIVISQIDV